jgi:hypothetical protein
MWPEEAAIIAAEGKSLTTLEGIGPSLARRLHVWLTDDLFFTLVLTDSNVAIGSALFITRNRVQCSRNAKKILCHICLLCLNDWITFEW